MSSNNGSYLTEGNLFLFVLKPGLGRFASFDFSRQLRVLRRARPAASPAAGTSLPSRRMNGPTGRGGHRRFRRKGSLERVHERPRRRLGACPVLHEFRRPERSQPPVDRSFRPCAASRIDVAHSHPPRSEHLDDRGDGVRHRGAPFGDDERQERQGERGVLHAALQDHDYALMLPPPLTLRARRIPIPSGPRSQRHFLGPMPRERASASFETHAALQAERTQPLALNT